MRRDINTDVVAAVYIDSFNRRHRGVIDNFDLEFTLRNFQIDGQAFDPFAEAAGSGECRRTPETEQQSCCSSTAQGGKFPRFLSFWHGVSRSGVSQVL